MAEYNKGGDKYGRMLIGSAPKGKKVDSAAGSGSYPIKIFVATTCQSLILFSQFLFVT